jgi:ubiquinone/menaquinone biosynthesis C-methylase UbiE
MNPDTMLVRGDGARVPFAGATFDAVFIATVLGEVPDRAGCLREVRRILRGGGVLAVAETRRDSDFIPFDTLRADVEPHGFRLRDKRGPGWQYVARFEAT